MEFTLAHREDTPAVGFRFETHAFSPEIGAKWEQVHKNGDFDRLMGKSKHGENFGLCIMDKNLPEGRFHYMIAVDHDPEKPMDEDMQTYLVKGGEYAVFRAPSMEAISDTFRAIYERILPGSEYRFSPEHGADFEYYSMQGDALVCDIYVPVALK